MVESGLVTIVGAVVLFSLATPVYAAHKFPEYALRPAGDYSVKAERAGLTIGVEPVEDLKDQKTYFSTELTPKGFIPVFVVIQNGSSEDSFLFEKTNVGYTGVSGDSTPKMRSKVGEGLALLGPGIIAIKLIANATEVQENMLKKKYKVRRFPQVPPCMAFCTSRCPRKVPGKIHLQVPMTKSGTSETFVLNLFF